MRLQALDSIKKAAPKKKDKDKSGSSISEDDAKRLEKEVSCIHNHDESSILLIQLQFISLYACQIDDLTKKFIKTAEDMCKAKEKEIRGG